MGAPTSAIMSRSQAEFTGVVWALAGGLLLVRAVTSLTAVAADEGIDSTLPLVLELAGALIAGALVLGLLWRGARRRAHRQRAVPLSLRGLPRALVWPALWVPVLLGLCALFVPAILGSDLTPSLAPLTLGLGVTAVGLALANLLPGRPQPAFSTTELERVQLPPRGVLLMDGEEPEAPRANAVRRHLRRVLGDRLTQPRRSLLKALWCRNVVAPLRARKLAREYRRVWTAEGGPRTRADRRIARALGAGLGPSWRVAVAGPRESGGLGEALDGLLAAGCQEIRVVPLLPQYSVAASGARIAELHRRLSRRRLQPALRIETSLHRRPGFLQILAENARPLLESAPWDRVVFAFPGRPVVLAADPYVPQCHGTARDLARELRLASERWALGFDDDLQGAGPTPDLRGVLSSLASKAPRVLLVPAGTTTDGVETLHGMAVELAAEFQRAGGRELRVVPALNDHPAFIRWLVAGVQGEGQGPGAPPAVELPAVPIERA